MSADIQYDSSAGESLETTTSMCRAEGILFLILVRAHNPALKVREVIPRTEHEVLREDLQVLGVESITGGTVTVRVLARCAPDENWGIQREIRRRVKETFDREGIAGPPIPMSGGGHQI